MRPRLKSIKIEYLFRYSMGTLDFNLKSSNSNNLTARDNPQPRFVMITGLIYMAESPTHKKYIGKHNTDDFTKRSSHITKYFEFLKKMCILELNKKFHPEKEWPKHPKGYCTALCHAFMKYGYMNFNWTVLCRNISVEELNSKEDEIIIKYNTLHPNGYNLKTNGTLTINTISDETRHKMSVSHKIMCKNNLHNYRKKHEELVDMPMHVICISIKNGKRGYRITNHPNCKHKQFADKTTPMHILKQKTLDFLKECEKTPYKTIQQKKAENGIPKGISEDNKKDAFKVQNIRNKYIQNISVAEHVKKI